VDLTVSSECDDLHFGPGIPWLRFIRQRLGSRVHFWPFEGWEILARRSAIAEVYPSLTPPERAVAQVEGWILGVA
jgi:hypothetical protein